MFVRMTAVAYMLHLYINGQNSSRGECKKIWDIVQYTVSKSAFSGLNSHGIPCYSNVEGVNPLFFFLKKTRQREKWAPKMGPFTTFPQLLKLLFYVIIFNNILTVFPCYIYYIVLYTKTLKIS